MRPQHLILGLVAVLMVVTGVLVYQGNQVTSAATAGGSSATSSSTDVFNGQDDPTTATTFATMAPAASRPASNVPMTKLEPGQQAPQFIIFSFDGAGSHQRWNEFMAVADQTNARFTGFLSGIYLLGDPAKNAKVYTAPGHQPGKASIGYGGPEDEIVTEVNDLNTAYSRGHEIGTHYNGHFCSDAPPGGNQWVTADWNAELGQFFDFVENWKTLNGYSDAPDLQVPVSEIKGGRTPCLEGKWDQLAPAWKKYGLTYDSSIPAPYNGIAWPEKRDGIWEFYMPQVYSPGLEKMTTAMDYNFWAQFNGAQEEPSSAPELRSIVKGTYEFMFDKTYNGNRAPILIANHFNKWNGDSFNPPAMDFMKEKCGMEGVICATYQDVIKWMELQDPQVLADLQAQKPVAGQAP
ncbi:polysaccharide deacetylase [Nakamurella flava]|uniref:Polysaccharide deacetylase n=1 Tax=Nakamurella flava TaxID=2576308 RepID=A0A4U6QMN4_9ACTN|nr:polysaccharide deacetylase [Nakamurella flava]TKV61910.1 polysaccharide deacetylase [Nakamurella flava]